MSARLPSRQGRVVLGAPKPEFTITVEEIRGGRVELEAFASDPVGALAEEAAEKLGMPVRAPHSASLAYRGGQCFRPTDRIGYPSDRTFVLVVTGAAMTCQRGIDSDLGWPSCNCVPDRPKLGECWCATPPSVSRLDRLPGGWKDFDTDEMADLCDRLGINISGVEPNARDLRKAINGWLYDDPTSAGSE